MFRNTFRKPQLLGCGRLTADASAVVRLLAPLDARRILGGHFMPRNPTRWQEPAALWRSFRTVAGPATLRIRTRTTRAAAAEVSVEVFADGWGPGAASIVERAAQLLGFDDDPSAFVPHHDVIVGLHRRFAGLRIGRGIPVMDVLVPSILGQRVKGSEAADSYRAMCFALGGPAPGPQKLQLPPDPRKLARMAPYLLHRYGVEAARAQTIVQCCGRAKRLQDIYDMAAPEAFTFLQRLRGIGPWTAALVVIATHGWVDGVVRGDYHMPNMVAWALAGEARADDDRMEELLAPYAGQRWRAVRLLEAGGIGAPKRGPRRATWKDAVELATTAKPTRHC